MILKLKNLKFHTIIGLYKWEDEINREININLEIEIANDSIDENIERTVDYDKIVSLIKDIINKKRYKLLETLAQNIVTTILEDKKITRCKIEIDKVGVIDSLESFCVIYEGK